MKLTRNITAVVLGFLVGLQPCSAFLHRGTVSSPAVNLGGIVAGINGISYFTNMRPFVNWAVQGGNGNGNRAFNSGAITELAGWQAGDFDSNGEIVASIPSGPTSIAISIFTIPPGVANSNNGPTTLPLGPVSATFQGTISGATLTVNSGGFSGTIVAGDQITAPGLQATVYNIQAFGTGGTTGTGGAGTYALNTSAPTISSAVSMNTRTYWWTGLAMTLQWQGTGVTSVTASGTVGTLGSFPTCTSSPCTFTFGYNPSNFALIFNFASGTASPPTKIQVYETRYATQMAACSSGTLLSCWSPDWVTAVGPIGIKRYMDAESSNSSGITDISQYADASYTHLANPCGGIGQFSGTISGTTLTITSAAPGTNLESGVQIFDATGQIAANTILQSGTGGTTGSYTINNSQTISNVTATDSTTNANAVLTVTSPSGTIYPFAGVSGTNISSNNTIILPYGSGGTTGTGGAGTYEMSNNANGNGSGQTATFTDPFYANTVAGSWFGTGGPKCGIHPSLLVALANSTNTGIHFNLPVSISDAGMTAIASYFNTNLKNGLTVSYEIGNENWNTPLGASSNWLLVAGRPIFNTGNANNNMAGYQMAHLMNIVNGVYGSGNRANWRGEVGGQFTNTAVASAFVTGVNTWIVVNSPTTNLWDLFDDVVVAPYANDFSNAATVTAVTTGNPTSVTVSGSTGQALANGQKRRLFFSIASGLSAYNAMDVTLANVSGSTFNFSDFTTTGTFTNSGANWMSPPGFFDMTDDSTACYVNAGATISAGSVTGSVLTAGGTVTGTIRNGQPLSGTGLPANLYIATGSGTSWNLNQSVVGTVTGAMTTAPCATNYQFFAQEYSKSLITGTNDYGFVPASSDSINGAIPGFLQAPQLYANSHGLQLRNYEGGFQTVTGGNFGANSTVADFVQNYFYDAAGNDPNYSPAKVVLGINNAMQNVWSAYPAHYMIYGSPGTFNALNYPGDNNAMLTQLDADNAAGPYVDPTPAATWSMNYNSSTDHNYGSGSSTTLTCTYTAPSNGLAVVAVMQAGTTTPSQIQIDSATPLTLPDAKGVTSWDGTIWSQTIAAGAHSVTVTWPSGVSARGCAAVTLTNLASNAVISTGSGQHAISLSNTKGAFMIAVIGLSGAATVQSASTPTGRTSGCPSACSNIQMFDYFTLSGQDFGLALWSPGVPFNANNYAINDSNDNGMVAATYK